MIIPLFHHHKEINFVKFKEMTKLFLLKRFIIFLIYTIQANTVDSINRQQQKQTSLRHFSRWLLISIWDSDDDIADVVGILDNVLLINPPGKRRNHVFRNQVSACADVRVAIRLKTS